MKPAARSGLAILLGTFVILALIALPALAYPDEPASDPAAPGFALPDFLRDFPVRLVQDDKKIGEQSTQVDLLYSEGASNTYEVSGAIIEYRYDPEKIDPDDEVTIVVNTPDDQDVETTFDLGHLR